MIVKKLPLAMTVAAVGTALFLGMQFSSAGASTVFTYQDMPTEAHGAILFPTATSVLGTPVRTQEPASTTNTPDGTKVTGMLVYWLAKDPTYPSVPDVAYGVYDSLTGRVLPEGGIAPSATDEAKDNGLQFTGAVGSDTISLVSGNGTVTTETGLTVPVTSFNYGVYGLAIAKGTFSHLVFAAKG